ncbi:MAG: hypothetical protein COA44_10915 [Arcobacter sp.]|nr:MAG: hypothetical protein COA44_10915 [Arcobacter sp.]
MSKLLSGFLLAGLMGLSAQADLLRFEMGGGIWQNELSGSIASLDAAGTPFENIDSSVLNYDKEDKAYVWMFIKHPIPILPNLRLEYASVDFSGASTETFIYEGNTYSANTKTDLTLDQFDIIMYYNLLDNTAWTTIDLGLDLKIVESKFNATDGDGLLEPISESETLPIPMAYARLRFELPLDIGIEGIGKYTSYKDSKVIDYLIKLDYTLTNILPIDIGLEAGYRFQMFDIDGEDFDIDTSADIEIDGLFFGAVVRF